MEVTWLTGWAKYTTSSSSSRLDCSNNISNCVQLRSIPHVISWFGMWRLAVALMAYRNRTIMNSVEERRGGLVTIIHRVSCHGRWWCPSTCSLIKCFVDTNEASTSSMSSSFCSNFCDWSQSNKPTARSRSMTSSPGEVGVSERGRAREGEGVLEQ